MKYSVFLLLAALLAIGSVNADDRMRRSSRHARRAAANQAAAAGAKGTTGANAKTTGVNAKAISATAKTTGASAKTASASAKTSGASANASSSSTASTSSTASAKSNSNDLSTSTTLDPSVIQSGSAQNGNPTGGQVASVTSTNNFINFCATSANGAPLMNGTQTKSKAACNPIPMGMIASQNNMPSGKFTNPKNLDTIQANTSFNITMKIQNLVTGNFVNPQTNYFSAPAQQDQTGNTIGHSHFVVEAIDSLQSTTVTNPLQFAFFKGVDPAAVNGVMTVNVPGGLPAGTFRLGSMNAAANHQPVLATVAQHGMFDDVVYFTSK
jgi:hypothetical protein